MLLRSIITGLASILLYAASIYAADTNTIYIEIVGEGKFEVLYHRVLSNATGAAIGGIIGAGIQSGIEAGKDEEKTKKLSPLIAKETWKTQFLDTLNDKLVAEGFKAVWVEDSRNLGNGTVLKIYPGQYGFKMVDTSTRLVSAFIDFKASFSSGNMKKEGEKEAYYITNKNQYTYENLLTDSSPVNSDLQAVLEKAANRLANKIIYSMKE